MTGVRGAAVFGWVMSVANEIRLLEGNLLHPQHDWGFVRGRIYHGARGEHGGRDEERGRLSSLRALRALRG